MLTDVKLPNLVALLFVVGVQYHLQNFVMCSTVRHNMTICKVLCLFNMEIVSIYASMGKCLNEIQRYSTVHLVWSKGTHVKT